MAPIARVRIKRPDMQGRRCCGRVSPVWLFQQCMGC
ncbi:unnamed protein product, partial [Laminaria digitata]